MTRWEVLQQWIINNNMQDQDFDVYYLAQDMGITTSEASELIQAYLMHQTGVNPQNLFILSRQTGRTRNAIWHVGNRVVDIRRLALQAVDDVECRVDRFLEPVFARFGVIHPAAQSQADIEIKAFHYATGQLRQLVTITPRSGRTVP